MSHWLKTSLVVSLFLVSVTCFLNWWGGYDGLNLIAYPFLCSSLVLMPINLVWTLAFLFKAKKGDLDREAFWVVLALVPFLAFFLPRFEC